MKARNDVLMQVRDRSACGLTHIIADIETSRLVAGFQGIHQGASRFMEIDGLRLAVFPDIHDVALGEYQQMPGIEGVNIDAGYKVATFGEGQINHIGAIVPDAAQNASRWLVALDICEFLEIEKISGFHVQYSTTGTASVKTRIGPRQPEYDHVLTRILHIFEGLSGFSFFLMLAVGLLWVIGNLQSFTLETQATLLQIMEIVGYSAVGVNFYALLLLILWGIRHHNFPGWRVGFSLLSLAIGLFLTLLASLVGVFLSPKW